MKPRIVVSNQTNVKFVENQIIQPIFADTRIIDVITVSKKDILNSCASQQRTRQQHQQIIWKFN